MRILVTGATGIVGSEVIRRLKTRTTAAVVGVSRRGDMQRDVRAWRMGLDDCPPEVRRTAWDVVIHCAADVRWNLPFEVAHRANVESTRAVLEVVGDATTVVHVSTAFATGLRATVDSDDPLDFRNSYEWSKAAAERAMDQRGPNWTVRPPMIIGGRSGSGAIERFHGVYQVLEAFLWGALPVIVANGEGPVELVAADDVADLVIDCVLAGAPTAKATLTMGRGEAALTGCQVITAIFEELNAWRRERGVDPLDAPPIVAPRRWERFFRPFAERHLSRSQVALIHALDAYLPYWAMNDHVAPNVIVEATEPVLRQSIRYWADHHPITARVSPRSWKAVG